MSRQLRREPVFQPADRNSRDEPTLPAWRRREEFDAFSNNACDAVRSHRSVA
jgi:hypothetical protein